MKKLLVLVVVTVISQNLFSQGNKASGNPVFPGWYGLKKGLRGRFGMYIPPLMEKLGLVELTHEAKGNKIRAK